MTSVRRQSPTLAAREALRRGEHVQAMALAEQAMRAEPSNPRAWRVAAEVALVKRDIVTCENYSRRALALDANDAESLYLLGTALARQKLYKEARERLKQALDFDPSHGRAWNNLGNVFRQTGRHEDAQNCYEQIFHKPGTPIKVLSNILFSLHFQVEEDHERQFEMHRHVGLRIQREAGPPLPAPGKTYRHRKIRVGYFSPLFKEGLIGNFFLPLFDAQDRSRFDVHLFSQRPPGDPCSRHLAKNADSWVETWSMDDRQFAKAVRKAEIDIFVDLAGHSPGGRLGVFALRPAPIQISMLDYFDTTGMDAIDYLVSDRYSSPENSPQQFSERLIRLSQPRLVYRPPTECPPPAPPPALRNGFLTFGSFNRTEKVNNNVIALWARVLERVPGSRLLLKSGSFADYSVKQRFTTAFSERGIDPERLEFRGWTPHREMLGEYGDVDIALDPFPWNGGLTTCEALWMGVPVISLEGSRIISRQSAGMMEALGLESFIAQSPADYVEAAARWAGHAEELAALRSELRGRMAKSRLCDGAAYARELESHFEHMIAERRS